MHKNLRRGKDYSESIGEEGGICGEKLFDECKWEILRILPGCAG